MKKWLSACLAVLLLLGMVGCGNQNTPTSQGGSSASGSGVEDPASGSEGEDAASDQEEEESPNDCNNLIEGGVCIEELEKNLQEMGYQTSNRPEDWDENIILVSAKKDDNDGVTFDFVCHIKTDGSVYAISFAQYANGDAYEGFATEFSQNVEAAFADICNAAPEIENTVVREYVPIPENYFDRFYEDIHMEYYDGQESWEPGDVMFHYDGRYDPRFFYIVSPDDE